MWSSVHLALALIHHTFRESKKRVQERVVLGVDATSLTGAHRLCGAAGMKLTCEINVFEKELQEALS